MCLFTYKKITQWDHKNQICVHNALLDKKKLKGKLENQFDKFRVKIINMNNKNLLIFSHLRYVV